MSSVLDHTCRACRRRAVHEDEIACATCLSRFADQVEAWLRFATRQEHAS